MSPLSDRTRHHDRIHLIMLQSILVKILLSPIALIYAISITIRNFFYESNLLKTAQFNIPVIGIGNLSMGGAGKTPHVEYLIRLLKPYVKVATLSRGYKRKTIGFKLAGKDESALSIGDEPLMYHIKYPEVHVSVSESRSLGVPHLLQHRPDTQVVLLDDHFQHRSIKAGLSILLTDYAHPYTDDYLLPIGRLREFRSAASRADIIIVTKCPDSLSAQEKESWTHKLALTDRQQLFFSYYKYSSVYSILNGERKSLLEFSDVLLVTSIANDRHLYQHLSSVIANVELASFEDHHLFSPHEISTLALRLSQMASESVIITTEKDATRLMLHRDYLVEKQLPIYLLPIEVDFIDDRHSFDELIKSFLLNFTV